MEYELPILGWRLYYSDGSSFSHEDGSWSDAPSIDVQVLEVLHEPPYRTLSHGDDEYRLPGEADVKFGRWADFETYEGIVRAVEARAY